MPIEVCRDEKYGVTPREVASSRVNWYYPRLSYLTDCTYVKLCVGVELYMVAQRTQRLGSGRWTEFMMV